MYMSHKNHQQFYNDANLYDAVLWEDSEHEQELYVEYASKAKSVLYLGCGSGRILSSLLNVCPDVVGVDSSEGMCKKSRENCPNATVICTDVLKLSLSKTFDLVIAPYEFLNHFDSLQLSTLFSLVSKHLNKGGVFVSQIKNAYHCIDKAHMSELSYIDMVPGNIVEKGYVTYDNKHKRYYDYIERIHLDTQEYNLITMGWYYYFPEDLQPIFTKNDLTVKHVYGEFSKTAFSKDSSVCIIDASTKE